MADKEKTQRILNFIVRYKLANDGISPTLQEIGDECGIPARSNVKYHLEKLSDAGLIENTLNTFRAIRVVGAEWTPPVWYDVKAPAQ